MQWYEYTGVFGGTLWVLLSNILIFEALQARRSTRRWAAAACSVALPMIASLCIWQSWEQPDEGTARVSVIQPNVDCYDKFHGDTQRQERNIADLMAEVPAGAQFILLPETAVPGDYLEPGLSDFYSVGEPGAFWQELTDSLRSRHPEALLITGAGTRPGRRPRRPARNASATAITTASTRPWGWTPRAACSCTTKAGW